MVGRWVGLVCGLLLLLPVAGWAQGMSGSVLYADPTNSTARLVTPSQKCAGNNGPDFTSGGAWGISCLFMKPRLEPGAARPLYSQTYGLQVGVEIPSLPGNPGRAADNHDQVAIYPEVRSGAWSNAAWAINPLIWAGQDSGGTIVDEADLNNFSGCDSRGIDMLTTGGSNPFIANRSDGSPCPTRIGLLITGVGNRVSSSAIDISGVSNSAGMMWQDGIEMVGGYVVNEYEFYSDTLAKTAIRIKGVHGYWGLDLHDSQFGLGAIGLSSASSANGRIVWTCPATGCGKGYPGSVAIVPANDGTLHVSGADLTVERTLHASQNITVGPGGNFISIGPDGRMGAFFGTDPATGLGTIGNGSDAGRSGLVTGIVRAHTASVTGVAQVGQLQANGAIRFAVRERRALPERCADGDTFVVRELKRLATCVDGRFYADGKEVE